MNDMNDIISRLKKFSNFPPCTKEWYKGEYEYLQKHTKHQAEVIQTLTEEVQDLRIRLENLGITL